MYTYKLYYIFIKKNRWTTSNKAIFNLGYHLIWCPKYRRKVLVGDIEQRLKFLLLEKAKEISVKRLYIKTSSSGIYFIKIKTTNTLDAIIFLRKCCLYFRIDC